MLFDTVLLCVGSVVVVAFDEKLIVYDACRFRERFTITGCIAALHCSDAFWLAVNMCLYILVVWSLKFLL